MAIFLRIVPVVAAPVGIRVLAAVGRGVVAVMMGVESDAAAVLDVTGTDADAADADEAGADEAGANEAVDEAVANEAGDEADVQKEHVLHLSKDHMRKRTGKVDVSQAGADEATTRRRLALAKLAVIGLLRLLAKASTRLVHVVTLKAGCAGLALRGRGGGCQCSTTAAENFGGGLTSLALSCLLC